MNELYPHNMAQTKHRAVNMPDPESMYFLLTGKNKPLMAGYDITNSSVEAECPLVFFLLMMLFIHFRDFSERKDYYRDGQVCLVLITTLFRK